MSAPAGRPVLGQTAVHKLVPVIRMLERGQYPEAHAELCRLTAYQGTPLALPPPAVLPVLGAGILHPTAQPKPAERIVDVAALDRFHEANPWCWVLGCGRRAGRPHHLRKRSDHGDDVDRNLFALCDGPDGHHRGNLGFHTIEPYGAGFYVVYFERLLPEHRVRIVAAMPEIEPVIAQILKREIVVHPAAARALIAA